MYNKVIIWYVTIKNMILQNPALVAILNFQSSQKTLAKNATVVSEKIKIKKNINDNEYHLMPKDHMVILAA